MADFTTEESLPFVFKVVDGHEPPRIVKVDESAGPPAVATSDATIATIDPLTKNADGTWNGVVQAVTPGTAHLTVTADADLGEGVQPVIGEGDVTVILDEKSKMRIAKLEFGPPVAKL
jgi:hypothetical protein